MKKKFVECFAALLAIALTLAACSSAASQPGNTSTPSTPPPTTSASPSDQPQTGASDWPNETITLYVGFSAGGTSDLQARYIAAALGNILGVSVIVENVPGSAGALCYNKVLNECAADGYSFVLANMPALDMGKYDEANPREFSVDDFMLLCNHVTDYNVIAVRNDDSRFTDLTSIIQYSQDVAPVLVGAAATGITSDDATVLQKLNSELGLEYELVPTDGSKDTETLFIQGNTDIMIANVADVKTAVETGQYKVLCVFSEERSSMIPDVPAFSELGYDCENIVNFSARGYAYPKGVDEEIAAKMTAALEEAINSEEVMTQMEALGAEIDFRSTQDYNALIRADIESGCKAFGVTP